MHENHVKFQWPAGTRDNGRMQAYIVGKRTKYIHDRMDRFDALMTGRGLYLDPPVAILGQAHPGMICRFV